MEIKDCRERAKEFKLNAKYTNEDFRKALEKIKEEEK